jgi:hypothetical protein
MDNGSKRVARAMTKGKVLKVRLGYNANSSSLSAIVSLLLLGSAAAVTVVGMVSAVLFSKAAEKKDSRAEE